MNAHEREHQRRHRGPASDGDRGSGGLRQGSGRPEHESRGGTKSPGKK